MPKLGLPSLIMGQLHAVAKKFTLQALHQWKRCTNFEFQSTFILIAMVMNNRNEQLETLQEIRSLMERSSR
ncbi:MAG: hypothetical protein AAFY76_23990, partial [Cyanobacteria bacterium J06649_11]